MHERIKKLRKALDLTQREFGERIGVKPNTIATYEIGRNEPIDAVISLICREFNVSETWLRTGAGEMFVKTPSDALDALAQEYNLDRFGRAVIEKMVNLNEKQRELLSNMVIDIVSHLSEEAVSQDIASREQTQLDPPRQERTEVDIAAELAELKRQNQELAAEIAAVKGKNEKNKPTPISEDELEEMFIQYVQELNPQQQQMMLEQMQWMTGPQKAPSPVFAQPITDETTQ